jgi:hypothetical protein
MAFWAFGCCIYGTVGSGICYLVYIDSSDVYRHEIPLCLCYIRLFSIRVVRVEVIVQSTFAPARMYAENRRIKDNVM